MTGKSKLNELGGLYKRMPWAMIFTVIGGISISGFPLTSGFISKSMIIAAAGESHRTGLMLMMTLAAVGTFLSVGIKLPYFIWFGKDSGVEAKDAPWNMNLGMAIAAFLCFFLGVFPDYLYKMLPFPVHYHPYTAYHLAETMQLLGFTGLGFFIMVKKLKPKPKMNLDLDWFYRKGARVFMWVASRPVLSSNNWINDVYRSVGLRLTMALAKAISWFDWEGIDWTIDGSARGVVEGGNRLRSLMTGKIQHYIGGAVALTFIILILVMFV
jgi:multicomponent Na+:H+ antiporter subunit D